MTPTRAIRLFGTEEPVAPARRLTAGALTAELDGGALRYIRLGGREVLRGVAFLVRDRNWGTYIPAISDLDVSEGADGFTVTYSAVCKDATQGFRFDARIEGRTDGSLVFSAAGEALTDFVTNRCGFVVLHPLAGVVGAPVTVEHTDGRVVESVFPEVIDPACPFQDIRALAHEVSPGVRATCRMEGDAFEMEDHRNWMDASYKTYVRPLALPWPYQIAKGERTEQRVALTIEGPLSAPAVAGGASAVEVRVGGRLGHDAPRLGLGAPAEHVGAALERAADLRAMKPAHLVCRFDARAGHDDTTMTAHRELGEAVGADLVLEAVLPCVDASGAPTDDPAVMRRDIAHVAEAARAAGVRFSHVAVSPASDLKCTLPGSVFPPAPGWEETFTAARAAFPGVPVGGGMFSYFTELNRKRPPAAALDFICHSGCPIVHAGDDISVMENLEALPSIFASARALAGGKPYWIFPAAIAMRENPYGEAPAENPDNIRQAMNRVDPRERGLIGAAWYAGYVSHAARAGVDACTLAAVAGPSGVLAAPSDAARPWFDDRDSGRIVYPSYHALRAAMGMQGAVLDAASSDPAAVQALVVDGAEGREMLLANLTGDEVRIDIDGFASRASIAVLDEESFVEACRAPQWTDGRAAPTGSLRLKPYAVAHLVTSG